MIPEKDKLYFIEFNIVDEDFDIIPFNGLATYTGNIMYTDIPLYGFNDFKGCNEESFKDCENMWFSNDNIKKEIDTEYILKMIYELRDRL